MIWHPRNLRSLRSRLRSRNVWNGRWWVHVLYCSTHCEALHELERYNARAKRGRHIIPRSTELTERDFARDAVLRPWLSNLSICRLLFTSACSVERNNESCKRSSRQLRMAEADVSLPSQCSPVTQTQASQSRANPSGRKKRGGMRFRRHWFNFDVEATGQRLLPS